MEKYLGENGAQRLKGKVQQAINKRLPVGIYKYTQAEFEEIQFEERNTGDIAIIDGLKIFNTDENSNVSNVYFLNALPGSSVVQKFNDGHTYYYVNNFGGNTIKIETTTEDILITIFYTQNDTEQIKYTWKPNRSRYELAEGTGGLKELNTYVHFLNSDNYDNRLGYIIKSTRETIEMNLYKNNWQQVVMYDDMLDYLNTFTKNLMAEERLSQHPIGSIEINTTGTNPSQYLGGTWETWGEGRFLLGVDSLSIGTEVAEATGGNSTVTLTVDNLPSHSHPTTNFVYNKSGAIKFSKGEGQSLAVATSAIGTDNTGKGTPIDITPPFVTAYIWKRIA